MGIEFNPSSLNANEIFAKLDAADGSADGKINKSIWNSFADVAGGNKIKNFIEEKNAVASIVRYLAKASDEVKASVCEYLNKSVNEVKPQEKASSVGETNTPKKNETERTKNVFKGYDFTKRDLLGDSIGKIFKDSNGNYIGLGFEIDGEVEGSTRNATSMKTKTTDARRKEVLNFKGKNGYNYVKAKRVIEDIKEKYITEWRKTRNEGDGKTRNSNEGIWILHTANNNPNAAQNAEYIWEHAVYQTLPEDVKQKYDAAKSDMEYIKTRYSDVDTCVEDLEKLYYYGESVD